MENGKIVKIEESPVMDLGRERVPGRRTLVRLVGCSASWTTLYVFPPFEGRISGLSFTFYKNSFTLPLLASGYYF